MGGILFLRSSLPEMDFAETFLSGTHFFNNATGNYNHPSYEVGIGYDLAGSGNDVRLNFAHSHTRNEGSLAGGNELASTVADVSTPIDLPSSTSPITAITNALINPDALDFIKAEIIFLENRIDLEGGQSIKITPYLRLRLFGGLRAANLRTLFNSQLEFDTGLDQSLALSTLLMPELPPTDIVDLTHVDFIFSSSVSQSSHFSGIGPRFGIEANYYLDIGISLFASSSVGLLVGNQKASRVQINETFLNAIVSQIVSNSQGFLSSLVPGELITEKIITVEEVHEPTSSRVVPNVEARLGICYAPCLPCTCSRVFLELGFMINHYFQAYDRLTEIASNEAFSSKHSLAISFDGIYLRAAMHI
jgi:hypothetical protein